MAPHAGIIIAASVLVAAGIAAYENPQFREWVEKSSSKVAMAFRSLGDDLHGRRRAPRNDPSMHEDGDEKAEERRRQARQEIMDRGRVLQEKRKRGRLSADSSRTPSFDSMVDEQGNLRPEVDKDKTPSATTTAFDKEIVTSPQDTQSAESHLRSRNTQPHRSPSLSDSVDRRLQIRHLSNTPPAIAASQTETSYQSVLTEPWESQYEQEMRTAWNIQLPILPQRNADTHTHTATLSHASESLIDLTPTTEDFPDPDYSIPSASVDDMQPSDYFSRGTSHNHSQSQSQNLSQLQPRPITPSSQADSSSASEYYYAHPTSPLTPLQPRPISQLDNLIDVHPGSSAASVAGSGSVARITHSEAETDDDLSEFGDGVRTPASAWTEVGSEVSGDA